MASRPLGFLDLPGEVRHLIYDYLRDEWWWNDWYQGQDLQILSTCRTIRDEASYFLQTYPYRPAMRAVTASRRCHTSPLASYLALGPAAASPLVQNLDLQISLIKKRRSLDQRLSAYYERAIEHFAGSNVARRQVKIRLLCLAPPPDLNPEHRDNVIQLLRKFTNVRRLCIRLDHFPKRDFRHLDSEDNFYLTWKDKRFMILAILDALEPKLGYAMFPSSRCPEKMVFYPLLQDSTIENIVVARSDREIPWEFREEDYWPY
ncbi:hypothetical protein ACLMJK_007046 [Lecanora helva]